ncbi:2-keto-4-pentenoate hydratase [Sphingomonas sp. RS2018]
MGDTRFDAAGDIARSFVEARRDRRGLTTYPGTAPRTMDEAYQVQDAAIALHGQSVAGWKLGKIPAPTSDTMGANRLAGPIFADSVVQAGADATDMFVFADGFAAAEAEFLLRVGTAPEPGRSDYTIADVRDMIDAVHAGIEIASSPYPAINIDGPAVTASDFGNNNGLLVGDSIADWRTTDLNLWPVELLINDELIGTGLARDMLDGPFGAAAFLFNLAARRGIAITVGQWISSGAVTGVHPVKIGDRVEARFDGGHAVHATIRSY